MASGDIIRLGGGVYIRDLVAKEALALKDPCYPDGDMGMRKTKQYETDFSSYVVANAITSFDVCTIADNKILIIYNTSSANLSVVAATVDPATGGLTFGTPYTMSSATSLGQFACCQLDTNKALIAYYNGATTAHAAVKVLTITDLAISGGTEATVPSAVTGMNLAKLDTDKVILAYCGSASTAACVITISGTTPTVGTAGSIDAAVAQTSVRVVSLSTSLAAVFYHNASNYLVGCHLSISGTTLTVTAPVVLDAVAHTNVQLSVIALSATRIVVFDGQPTSPFDTLTLISVTGAVLAVVTTYSMYGAISAHGMRSMLKLSATRIRAVAGMQLTSNNGATASYVVLMNAIFDFTGDVITLVGVKNYTSWNGNTTNTAKGLLTPLVPGTPDMGMFLCGLAGFITTAIVPNSSHPEGLCVKAAAAGGTASISLGGLISGLSGLTAGAMYGIDASGTLSTTIANADISNNHILGFAISATEIYWLPKIARLPYIPS